MKQLLLILLVSLVGCAGQPDLKLRVAAASSLQPALDAIAIDFEEEHQLKVDLIYGSSGKLSALLEHGAPYDFFLSAHEKYPRRLVKLGLIEGEIEVFAFGKLVIWTTLESAPSLGEMLDSKWAKIALPNPETAPFGQAAKEAMVFAGVWDSLQDKLVFGESVSQTNQFILSKGADCGITSGSVRSIGDIAKDSRGWEIPADHFQAIQICMVRIKGRPELNQQARQFHDYIFSDKAQENLLINGFLPAVAL